VRFPTLKQAAFVGAVFGAVGALLYYISQPARNFILATGCSYGQTGLIIIVTYGHEHDLFGYVVTAVSIVLNIALYAAAVMLLWLIAWIVRRVAAAKR
jgi:hypothetical protein